MSKQDEYILGARTEEIARLGIQHQVWAGQAAALFERAGFGPGDVVLDLGCGPGFTSFDLAGVVGPDGKVIGRDKSEHFLEFLRKELRRRDLPQIEVSLGPVEEIDLPAGALDGAYARWLFCWLSDPGETLARVASALKPNGVIALQEYLDWGAMKLMPKSASFDRVVEACMSSWIAGGVTIDFADRLPILARQAGLELEIFRPIARVGLLGPAESGAGSPEWRWVSDFLDSYLPGLVERDLLTQEELDVYRRERDARAREGATYLHAPVMAEAILRRP